MQNDQHVQQTWFTITKFPITITITSKMSGFFERKITLNDRQNDWDCLSFHCQSRQSRHHPFKATEAAKTAVFPMSMAPQQANWRFLIINHAFSLYRTVGVGHQPVIAQCKDSWRIHKMSEWLRLWAKRSEVFWAKISQSNHIFKRDLWLWFSS